VQVNLTDYQHVKDNNEESNDKITGDDAHRGSKGSSQHLDGMVKYATSRINARRASAICNNGAPKVGSAYTFANTAEFRLSFGDYCEAIDLPAPETTCTLEERNYTSMSQ
jgi:hypothetical protein